MKDFLAFKLEECFMLIIAFLLYFVLWLVSPDRAYSALLQGWNEIQGLFIPILGAVFIGGTIQLLVQKQVLTHLLNRNNKRSIFFSSAVGSILPPCPFIAYPIIKSFHSNGMGLPPLIAMLIAATLVEIPQIFAGLAVFSPQIVGLRISFALIATIAVALGFNYFYLLYQSLQSTKA